MGQVHWNVGRRAAAALLGMSALVLAACGSSSGSSRSTATAASNVSGASTVDVKTGSTSLGTVLVNSRSRTLYHLTAEKNGRFICTNSSCLQLWHPLRPRSKTPKGTVHSLGLIRRPDGTKQITYKGFPLYTFAQDRRAGDVKGQGFKDVGTWKAVVVRKPSSTTQTQTQTQTTTTPSSGGGYGY
jgi:predicted lipoprotein with Yx(FWY)xxD motif